MAFLDQLLLASTLSIACWRFFGPAQHPRRRAAVAGLAISLAAAKWIVLGFTWQDLPALALLLVAALPPLHRRASTRASTRAFGRVAMLALSGLCVGVWSLPAVPTLPAPDGPHSIGTEVFRWTDASRDEPRSADTSDRRSVIAQMWYPASPRSETAPTAQADYSARTDYTARADYLDGRGNLPPRISGAPSVLLSRYHQIDTHAERGAPLARAERPWPVIVFSPGYGAPRAAYTGLATRLASRGFVVLVLDHPYESAVTELPDGRIVGTQETFQPGQRDRGPYMAEQQRVRTADIRFVIDQVERSVAFAALLRGAAIDTSKIAVIGHSFGGAVSLMAMSEDRRVAAAVNIDGTPYGDLPERELTRPIMLITSDLAASPHGEVFHRGNGELFARAVGTRLRFELKHADHYSFTDAFFYFAAPARWLLGRVIGAARGPAETQQATADLVAAFLSGPLTNVERDVAAVAAQYTDVIGGHVSAPLHR